MRAAIIFIVLFTLGACGGKDIPVSEYSSHMEVPFDRLDSRHKIGKAKVVVVGEYREKEKQWVADAVSALNKKLPSCVQLTVLSPNPSLSFKNMVSDKGKFPWYPTYERDKLYIEFIKGSEHWNQKKIKRENLGGTAWTRYIQIIRGTRAYNDGGDKIARLLIHEIVHSLGVRWHVPDNVRSIMNAGNMFYRWHYDGYLSKSDIAALNHIYPCG